MPHSKRTIRRTTAGLVFAIGIVAVVSVLSFLSLRKHQEEATAVLHTNNVILLLGRTLSNLQDAETGQRGYLLTDKESYLKPYNGAADRIEADMQALRMMTRDNPAQQTLLEKLHSLATAKLSELAETIQLRRTTSRAAALAVVQTDRGRDLMERARGVIASLQESERRELQLRLVQVAQTERLTFAVVLGGSSILLVLLGGNLLVIRHDLQRREEITEALRQSEERLGTTLASIGDAVLVTDATRHLTFLNAVAEELTGWKQAQAQGRPVKEIFHIVNESTRDQVESPVDKVIELGKIVGLANHTVLIRKDKTERHIEDSGAPIWDKQGNLIGVILVFRDITARREQEGELQKAHAEMLVLNERLKRSITETHHRVKNSLQLMTALIDIQASEAENETISGQLEQLKGQLRALSTVHDVLTIQSKQEYTAQTLSSKELLEKLLAMTARIAPLRSLLYQIEDVPITGKVGTSLALATNEIVLNALKHGTGAIQVVFAVQEERACLEVQDEGPGLPQDFDPSEAASTGLTLIESLVKWDLKGEVSYRNREDGKGTCVTAIFPLELS